MITAIKSNAQQYDGGLEMMPLERALVTLHEYVPPRMRDDLDGGLYLGK